jgi:hypothetical protein
MNWESALQELTTLLEIREHYQRRLGELASGIASEFGPRKLVELADQISELSGRKISLSSLRNYRWVYEMTKDLNLPEDISYRTCQTIASSGRPEYWSERIKKEGLASAEVYKMIRKEKGLDKKSKQVICTACGATNYV